MQVARHTLAIALVFSIAISAQQVPPPQAAKPAGKGIIRGVVTALDTGRPIRNAAIAIQIADGPPVLDSRSVFTDAQGRYEITGLKAGRYTLNARKAGYLSLSYGQTRVNAGSRPVTLSESTPLDKIDFALPLAGVIVAHITDQFGDPVRGVMVRPFVQRYMEGRRQLSSLGLSGAGAVTDDRGETRIYGLAPGDYYLAALPDFTVMWRGDVETLFPGTLDVASAQTVRVGAGQEVFVTFPIQRARSGSLSGRVVNSDGGPPTTPFASLEQVQLSGGGSSRRINLAPDGSFREENLPPGDWMIVANEPEYGSARVRLLGDAVQGITVTTRKAAAVRGRVKFEGAAPPANRVVLYVTFDGPRAFVSGAGGFVRSTAGLNVIAATPEEQWAFEAQISGVGAIRARDPAWILKAVLLDGKDVTDTPLDFGAAYSGKPVEVVLTQRKGEVSGVVQNDRGQLTSDYQVVIFPEDEMQWTPFSRAFAAAGPDQQGRFTIQDLPPARYLAAAVESLAPGDERNPEVLSRLRGGATSFELSEGESRTVTLRLTR
jgi:protocatechuate 3,4-dioxygenase beta subunit